MPNDAVEVINAHLKPGERLFWAGRPKQGLLLRAEDVYLIPFSLLWSFITLPGIVSRLVAGGRSPGFIDIIFLAIGFYLLLGRFLHDIWLRSRAYYGLTTERALIVAGYISPKVHSFDLRTLSGLELTERGRRGTIRLAKKKYTYPAAGLTRASTWPAAHAYLSPAFEMIPDARQVYDMIVQLQYQTRQTV